MKAAGSSPCTGVPGSPIRVQCKMRTAFAATDAAHATHTLFHVAHIHLFRALSKDHLFVSLHGKAGASFIVSDGTTLDAPMPAAAWPSMRFAALFALRDRTASKRN